MTEKQYTVSFEVDVYRNGELDYSKKSFITTSREVTRESLSLAASHIIKEGKREEYEMVHGSCFGKRVTIERKLGRILQVTEITFTPKPIDYSHAYAEDSRYNYNG